MTSHGPPDAAPSTGHGAPPPIDFERAQADPRFQRLRRSHRSFVFPLTVAFLVWYLAYAVTAMYAPGFMSHKVVGNVNVGIVWGLLQFASTFGITAWYVLFANRRLDPRAVELREEMEAGGFSGHDAAPAGGDPR
ncbi:DUF485 domain-containing protein [Rothia halotolerans]|uniref:DUF485 domain-containing protein n=1 Tax=Rothia halotolerans TaxID=405770 RepID=UPI00101CD1AB|nr:DUF485 domain-containing protein [Rothia halotolerans]